MEKSTPTPMITDDSNAVTWFKSIFRIPMKPKFKITAADNGITAKIPQPRCLKNIAAINFSISSFDANFRIFQLINRPKK